MRVNDLYIAFKYFYFSIDSKSKCLMKNKNKICIFASEWIIIECRKPLNLLLCKEKVTANVTGKK